MSVNRTVARELPSQELLHGVEHRAGITNEEQVVLAGQLHDLRTRHLLGIVTDLRRVAKALAIHE